MLAASLLLAQLDRGALSRDAIRDLQTSQNIAGMAVRVYQDGNRKLAFDLGSSNVDTGEKVGPKTLFRLASVSKPITATAVMQAVERGQLKLDAPLTSTHTGFEATPSFTMRQLLAHRAGIRHYQMGSRDLTSAKTPYRATQREAVGLFSTNYKIADPGTKYSYSTHGYTIAGAVLESLHRKPFPELMRQGVFRFAEGGLDVENPSEPAKANRSHVYSIIFNRRGEPAVRDDNSWKYGGGGMEATADGLAKWGSALLAGKIVSFKSLDEMSKFPEGTTPYGLGFGVPAEGILTHNGGQQGARSTLMMDRKSRTVVVVLCNTDGQFGTDRLAKYLFELYR
jgi:serine beta-lactamase-like protein LACTB, mitochondrial